MKRILAVILSALLLLQAAPLVVFAGETVEKGQIGDNVFYTLDDEGTLTISGEGATYDYFEWDSPLAFRADVMRAVIEEGVTGIGVSLFMYDWNLAQVELPDSLRSVGDDAFSRCALSQLDIPAGVEHIGTAAFAANTALTAVNVADGSTHFTSVDGVLFTALLDVLVLYPAAKTNAQYTVPEGVTEIGDYAFYEAENLESVVLPEGLTRIGALAFYGCTALAEINVPESVSEVGNYAFEDTPWYKSLPDGIIYIGPILLEYRGDMPENTVIEIKDGTTSIASSAFAYQRNLTGVSIPDSVTSLGAWAFQDCIALTEAELPDTLVNIGSGAFFNSGLTSVVIPDGVTDILEYTFCNCEALTDITLPSGLKAIGLSAISNCTALEQITLPEGIETVGESSFNGSAIKSITVPESVTDLQLWAFANCESLEKAVVLCEPERLESGMFINCTSLKEVTLPNSITYIGESAFEGCRSLTSIDLPDALVHIDNGAFNSTGLTEINLPAGVEALGDWSFGHSAQLETINYSGQLADICLAFNEGSENLSDFDRIYNVLFGTKWFSDNYMSGKCGENVFWRLEENDNGFWAWNEDGSRVENEEEFGVDGTHFEQRYTLIISGEGSMDNYFYTEDPQNNVPQPWENMRWQITDVVIEEGVTRVGDNAFRWSDSLRSVTLPETLTAIGEFAFADCVSGIWHEDEERFEPTGSLSSIYIPANVSRIDLHAFGQNCFLTEVLYDGDLSDVCLAGRRYEGTEFENFPPREKVRNVFDGTAWLDAWENENFMQGQCGENVFWKLEENENGFWEWDEINVPVENEEDFGAEGTHWAPRYTLTVYGEGDMDNYYYGENEDDSIPQPWDSMRWQITDVVVEEGVTSIGDNAFRWSDNLRNVSLPEGLVSIGENAFEACRSGIWHEDTEEFEFTGSLQSVTIPSSVTFIGAWAFAHNDDLSEIYFDGDLRDVCLSGDRYADWDIDNWAPQDKVWNVFEGDSWYESWYGETFLQGQCGENVFWKLEENENGFWEWNDINTPVENEEDFGSENTHWSPRYTLTVYGEGDMDNYYYGENEDDSIPQPWDSMRWQITDVVVEEGVTSIGDNALRWCDNLRSVSLPNGLLSIGENAFESCRSGIWHEDTEEFELTGTLESVTIPGSVCFIGMFAFAHNDYLTEVNFDGDLRDVCLSGDRYADWDIENWAPHDKVQNVFDGDPWYEAWYVENFMQGQCGENVFWKLEENGNGFWEWDEINVPVENEEDFGSEGTHWSPRYTLTVYGEGDMDNYYYGENDEDSVPQPWDNMRWQITDVVVEEGVTSIGDNAFRWCDNLRSVSLPESLVSIGEWAFESCRSGIWHEDAEEFELTGTLESVTIPSGVQSIGDGAFRGNDFLSEVNFDGDLISVCLAGDRYADWDIENWYQPDRVRSVFEGSEWFDSWFRENFMQGQCGENVFWSLEENGNGFWAWNEDGSPVDDPDSCNPEDIHWETRYTLVISGDGAIFDYAEGESAPWAYYGWAITDLIIEDGVTSIGQDAFIGANNLERVSLPESLTAIGPEAFFDCNALTEIEIPQSAETIEAYAFGNCFALETVLFCGSEEEWNDIEITEEGNEALLNAAIIFDYDPVIEEGRCGENTFYSLTRSGILTVWGEGEVDDSFFRNDSRIVSVIFEEGVTGAGERAFFNCEYIESFTFPETFVKAGFFAFERSIWLAQQPDGIVYAGKAAYTYKGTVPENTSLALKGDTVSISAGAFEEQSGIAAILLPDTLEFIGNGAFEDDENLGTVYFAGTAEQWADVETGENNDALASAKVYFAGPAYEWIETALGRSCTATAVSAGETVHVITETAKASYEETKAPTCTEDGEGAYTAAFNNKRFYSQTEKVVIPMLGHDLVSHEAKAATCTEKGWKEYQTCSRCDYTTYEEIAALGHSYGAWTKLDEKQHQRVCANDASHVEKADHAWDGGKVTTPATAAKEGVRTFTCSVCGATKTEQIPKTMPEGFMLGDMNLDKEISAEDARLALRQAVKLERFAPDSVNFKNGDVNFSGDITADDARSILRAAVKLEDPADWLKKMP
ncbi:MAG: leucine-rich repeat protein [Clostridia bacterium]|nr:leucine-rich repeat protein [Clostridia bacterium]